MTTRNTKARVSLLVCLLVLVMALTCVFAFTASADHADTTALTSYSVTLSDGMDVTVNGTVSAEDAAKTVTLRITNRYGEEPEIVPVVPDGNGNFSYTVKKSAAQIADATILEILVDGESVAAREISPLGYFNVRLNNPGVSAAEKAVCSDAIRYGSAVLKYLGKTSEASYLDSLQNLTEGAEYAAPAVKPAKAEATDGATVAFSQVGVALTGKFNLYFVTDADGSVEYTAEGGTFGQLPTAAVYGVLVENIPVTAFYDAYTVAVKNGEDKVSDTITYSVAAYVDAMDEDATVGALVKALANYAVSAHAIVGCDMQETARVHSTCQVAGSVTKICTDCGATDVEELPLDPDVHANYTKTATTADYFLYACADCDFTWASIANHWTMDGTNKLQLSGSSAQEFDPANTDYKPAIVDGYYSGVIAEGATKGQVQWWIGATKPANVNAANDATAMYSFKFKAPAGGLLGKGSSAQLVEDGNGGGRWTKEWAYAEHVLKIAGDGTVTGLDNLVLGTVTADAWTQVDMYITFDTERDQVAITYYVNGKGIATGYTDNTTINNGFNCLYIAGWGTDCSGSTVSAEAIGEGLLIDDITFGYTLGKGAVEIGETAACGSYTYTVGGVIKEVDKHDWEEDVIQAATCTTPGSKGMVCTGCGESRDAVAVPATGHIYVMNSSDLTSVDHSASHNRQSGTLTYKCYSCTKSYTVNASGVVTFENCNCSFYYDCGTVINKSSVDGATNNITVSKDGELSIVGALNPTNLKNNLDIRVLGQYAPISTGTVGFVSVDIKLPSGGMSENGLGFNFKCNNSWMNPGATINDLGVLNFNGKNAQLSKDMYTNVAFLVELEEGAYTFTMWVNGQLLSSKRIANANVLADTTFATANTYFNLTIGSNARNVDATRGIIIDNIAWATSAPTYPAAE